MLACLGDVPRVQIAHRPSNPRVFLYPGGYGKAPMLDQFQFAATGTPNMAGSTDVVVISSDDSADEKPAGIVPYAAAVHSHSAAASVGPAASQGDATRRVEQQGTYCKVRKGSAFLSTRRTLPGQAADAITVRNFQLSLQHADGKQKAEPSSDRQERDSSPSGCQHTGGKQEAEELERGGDARENTSLVATAQSRRFEKHPSPPGSNERGSQRCPSLPSRAALRTMPPRKELQDDRTYVDRPHPGLPRGLFAKRAFHASERIAEFAEPRVIDETEYLEMSRSLAARSEEGGGGTAERDQPQPHATR